MIFVSRSVSCMQQIRVLIANHHPIVRNGLRALLERDSRIRVVAEAANGREAITLADYRHPEVVVLDVDLHLIRGIDVARAISESEPKTRIVFVSSVAEESYVQEAFRAGARGYVLENLAQTDLLTAISAVVEGGVFVSSPAGCTATGE